MTPRPLLPLLSAPAIALALLVGCGQGSDAPGESRHSESDERADAGPRDDNAGGSNSDDDDDDTPSNAGNGAAGSDTSDDPGTSAGGSDTGDDNSGGTGTGEPEQCDGPTASGDLEARRVEISGVVTVDGQLSTDYVGDAAAEDAGVTFVEQTTGALTSVWASTSGAYEVLIGAGVYDVSLYFSGATGRIPVLSGVALGASQSLNLDLGTVIASGEVTLRGGAFPETDEAFGRGQLVFRDSESQLRYSAGLPLAGAASYRLRVPADGHYDVSWERSGRIDALPTQPGLPMNAVPYGQAALGSFAATSAETETVLDLDVEAPGHRFTGSVTSDGQPITTDTGESAEVAWLSLGPLQVSLFSEQANYFDVTLLDAEYDVFVMTLVELGSFPSFSTFSVCVACRSDAAELDPIDIATLSEDEPSIAITGTVRVHGEGWPPADLEFAGGDGRLDFVSTETVVLDESIALPPSSRYADVNEAGDFALDLRPGSYDVFFASTGGAAGRVLLEQGRVIDDAVTHLEFDAPVTHLEVEILMNGATMPGNGVVDGDPRAHVQIRGLGKVDQFSLGTTGPALFDAYVLVGDYELWIGSWSLLGRTTASPNRQDVLPVGIHRLGQLRILEAGSQREQFDARVRTFSGTLSHTGVENVVPSGNGYVIRFINQDDHAFWTTAPTTSGSFELLLYDGLYRVEVGDAMPVGTSDSNPVYIPDLLTTGDSFLGRSVYVGDVCVGP